jgi:Coenzyme PQQ synthesis protein D (PqqD)
MLTLDCRLRIADRAATRKVGDDAIILNIESGTYFGLDAIGARFIELLEGAGSVADVLPAMLNEYAVSEGQLQQDLLRLAQHMLDSGLLERE